MKKRISLFLILSIFLTAMVFAGGDPGADKLLDLFAVADNQVAELFDESVLAQVPAGQLIMILQQYKGNLGELLDVSGSSGNYTLFFEKGIAPAQIYLNQDGKIIGLWFGHWTLYDDDISGILAEFKALEGEVSLAVIKNNQEELLTYNADQKMAVGSSFKLHVLKTVYELVEQGELSWDTVVILTEKDKSLPSGILQDWPGGTPMTLKTLTNLMISISDNTATDILINTVGRERIEKGLADRNIPFLKTSEFFKLKYKADPELQKKYLKATTREEKSSLLTKLNDLQLGISDIVLSPLLINELEWFFSTGELCDIIYQLRAADEIRINPGLAQPEEWYLVGFKGGSEPGVLQYTHLLQKDEGGDFYAISVTVNNPEKEVDQFKVNELSSRLIGLIKEGKLQ